MAFSFEWLKWAGHSVGSVWRDMETLSSSGRQLVLCKGTKPSLQINTDHTSRVSFREKAWEDVRGFVSSGMEQRDVEPQLPTYRL